MKKRFIVLLAGLLMGAATQAMAASIPLDNWQLNLSSFGGGSYTNIDHLNVAGGATVVQNLPIAVGSTFTETAQLGVDKGVHEPGNLQTNKFNVNTGTFSQLYFQATNLSGQITAIGPTGFTYSFTPGAGSISLILDNDGVAGTVDDNILATLQVIAPSGGTNNGFLGGVGDTGTTNLTAEFKSVLPGIFKTSSGTDFASLTGLTLGFVNTNNQVLGILAGPTSLTLNPVLSNGQANLGVVPEPSTMLLLGAGFMGLAIFRKRRSEV